MDLRTKFERKVQPEVLKLDYCRRKSISGRSRSQQDPALDLQTGGEGKPGRHPAKRLAGTMRRRRECPVPLGGHNLVERRNRQVSERSHPLKKLKKEIPDHHI